jgi:hypothetical protein
MSVPSFQALVASSRLPKKDWGVAFRRIARCLTSVRDQPLIVRWGRSYRNANRVTIVATSLSI